MVEISDFLRDLGLEKYVGTFAENEIDMDVLPLLSEQDLIDLGLPLGPRRKLQRAVADAMPGSPSPATAASPTLSVPPADMPATPGTDHPPVPGGLRQVTVLFADIAGYTSLSNALDAEEVHALLNRYFEVVDGTIQDYGGTIDKHIGDAVMAVFGAPVAHTNDPERAVRAALDIHAALARLSGELGRSLEAHIGIASGAVVAGGTGSQAHSEYTMTGDTVNLASRLDGLAKAGETLLSRRVRESVVGIADCSFRGAVEVKGFSELVEVWAVDGLRAEDSSPVQEGGFIGRQSEQHQFTALLDEVATRNSGRALLLRGEAGIGKSRLAGEFARLARDRGFRIHKGLVLDFGVRRGQDAIGGLARGLLGIGIDSNDEARQAAAQAALDQGIVAEQDRGHLLDLLDLPQPPDLKLLFDAMDNQRRIDGGRATLARMLSAAAAQTPVLVMVEDIHWADDHVGEFLSALAQAAPEAPILLLLTSRIEGRSGPPSWLLAARHCPVSTMELRPLGAEEAQQLAEIAAREDPALVADCIARAEGNPLFLTQLLRGLKESAGKSLPDSIHSVVLARMDRLTAADRQALQCAAVLGQRFPLDGLRHLLGDPSYDPAALIADLLIQPEGERFLFGHALIRDGAYSSMLRQQRNDLHRRAADFYEGIDLALRADHLAAAGDEAAADAFWRAAEAENALYHQDQALELVEKGLEQANAPTPATFDLLCLKVRLQQAMGRIGPATETGQKAIEIAFDPRSRCSAFLGMAESYRLLTEYGEALDFTQQAEQALGDEEDPLLRSRLHHLRGNLYFPINDLANCRKNHQLAFDYALSAQSPRQEALALGGLGDVAYIEGRVADGLAHFGAAQALCQKNGFGRDAIANTSMSACLELFRLNPARAGQMLREGLADSRRVDHLRGELLCLAGQGMLLTLTGPWEPLLDLAADFGRTRDRLNMSRWEALGLRLEALGRYARGEGSRAEELLAEAYRISHEGANSFDLLWCIGDRLWLTEDPAQVRDWIDEGESMLDSEVYAHNLLFFQRSACFAAAAIGDWDRLHGLAAHLERYGRDRAPEWTGYHVELARTLAGLAYQPADDEAIARLEKMRGMAETKGLSLDLAAITESLEHLWAHKRFRFLNPSTFAVPPRA